MLYTNEIDEQIAKFLAGECSPEEVSALQQWLAESADNQLYFNQMQKLWNDSSPTPLPRPLDVEQALARTKNKITAGSKPVSARRIPMQWMAIAASLVLLIGAFWFFRQDTALPMESVAATTSPVEQKLSDGSVISVNQFSQVAARFSNRKRSVQLNGEAYFAVAYNPERPFVIEVRNVSVTVLGTKFNVDNRSSPQKVIVSVDEGKVKVASAQGEKQLLAGDQAIIDIHTGLIEVRQTTPAENVTAWASRKFAFEDTPLSKVIPELEKVYQVKINLSNPVLEQCRLHVRFDQESIEHIMLVIAETFSLKLRVINGQYYLEGDACSD
ncbi:MAG: FecR domain-containing protein [Saprospiraceae bacterium]|nr:FecR domain-containing protein [Saprospiraceae bacterium]